MKRWYFIVGLVLVLGVLSGCNKEIEATQSEVVTEEVTSRSIKVDGTVRCTEKEDIYLEFPAILEKVYVEEGDIVKKGEVLFSFNNEDYIHNITEQENQIKSLELKLKQLQSQQTVGVSEISALKEKLQLKEGYLQNNTNPKMINLVSELELAKEQLGTLQDDYNNNQEVYEAGGVSEKTLIDLKEQISIKENLIKSIEKNIEDLKSSSQLEVEDIRASIDSKKVALSNAENTLAGDIEQTNIQLQMAKDTLTHLKEKLNKAYIKNQTVITTSDNMIISEVACHKGTRTSGKEVTLIKAISQDSLIVTLEVPAEEVGYLSIGQEVNIDAYIDEVNICGTVKRVSQKAITNDEDFVAVDIEITEGKEYLRDGVAVEAELIINTSFGHTKIKNK